MARPTLTGHPKFVRLAAAVGGKGVAMGSVCIIWDTTRVCRHLGDLETVEAMCDWRGDPGVLAAALLDAGIIAMVDGRPVVNRNGTLRRARMARSDYGPTWRSIKESIIDRDGRTCTSCGAIEKLEVHHIVPLIMFDGDLDAANASHNLITLCRPCHRTEDNRLRVERSSERTM